MKKSFKYIFTFAIILILSIVNVKAEEIKAEDVAKNTYVIGKHMFTDKITVSTSHIMLAAKSIDSNDLDDMIIYYKKPRTGEWINGATGASVEVPNIFEIEYVDFLLNVETPTLRNDTIENWNAQFEEKYIPTLNNGVYGYDLAINKNVYGEEGYRSVTGYVIYEKTAEGYTEIEDIEIDGYEVVRVEIEPGQKKEYVARVYAVDSTGERHYSDYSNIVTIDHTLIETPTLSKASGGGNNHTLTIGLEGYYVTEEALNSISGWELYEKVGSEYNLVDGYEVTVDIGESKKFVAKAYALNKSNEKVYSEYSNELVIDN